MTRTITIRGELWLTLETVAECYEVETTWVREVYEHGLLGAGEPVGGSIAIAAVELDRLAQVLRLNRQQGLDLLAVMALLDD